MQPSKLDNFLTFIVNQSLMSIFLEMKPSLIVMKVPGTPVVFVVVARCGGSVGGGHVTVSAGVRDSVSEYSSNARPPVNMECKKIAESIKKIFVLVAL